MEGLDAYGIMDMLPDMEIADDFLKELLPRQQVKTMDLMQDVLLGNWVIEPQLFWEYSKEQVSGYFGEVRSLFAAILLLFILSAIVTAVLMAFQNAQAAKAARLFFLLCQLVILLQVLQEVFEVASDAMEAMLEFLKLMIPAYMMCVAASGSGLTAMLFYKLLLGFLCLIEGVVAAGLISVAQGYMVLGVMESLFGEARFKGFMDLLKKGVLGILKGMIVLVSGSSLLQMMITPVVDKANLTIARKTVGAIPGIGDIAESITGVTIASAVAVKNSFGVVILLLLVLLLTAPVIRILLLLLTMKLGAALGGISGEKYLLDCTEYMADAGFLALRMLVTVAALFFLTIAALTNATGGSL